MESLWDLEVEINDTGGTLTYINPYHIRENWLFDPEYVVSIVNYTHFTPT